MWPASSGAPARVRPGGDQANGLSFVSSLLRPGTPRIEPRLRPLLLRRRVRSHHLSADARGHWRDLRIAALAGARSVGISDGWISAPGSFGETGAASGSSGRRRLTATSMRAVLRALRRAV